MTGPRFAVIGGTGLYESKLLEDPSEREVNTPYGYVRVITGQYKGLNGVFLSRHGLADSTPPHRINYRGNIWALKALGVTTVLTTSAVGSLTEEIRPGAFVVPDQILDFTRLRPATFFDGDSSDGVQHFDVTYPYAAEERDALLEGAKRLFLAARDRGTYVCVDGPRFETAAEVRMFRTLGGDIVGMTAAPEAFLAKELGLRYATLALVTNLAAGFSELPLTQGEVREAMKQGLSMMRSVICTAIEILNN
jgi:5'-methylthioadenosine phosphorylase